MTEPRIDLTAEQFRKFVESVWKEAYGDGWSDAISQGGYLLGSERAAERSTVEEFPYSLSAKCMEEIIALEQEHSDMSKHCIGESQCQTVGEPAPRTWDDYEQGCMGTFGGGYRTKEDLEIFHHGMSTVFNVLRAEFPTAAQCKAAPEMLEALRGLIAVIGLTAFTHESQRAVLQDAVDAAIAAIAKAEGREAGK